MATRIENGKTKLIAGAIYERTLSESITEHAQCTCTKTTYGKVVGFFQRYNHTSTSTMVENTEECEQWTMISRPVTVEEIAEMVQAALPKKAARKPAAKKAAPKQPAPATESTPAEEKPKTVRRRRASASADV